MERQKVADNSSISISNSDVTADDDVFPIGYEAAHMIHSTDFTPKSRNVSQYRSEGSRKIHQPTIMEEESEIDENMMSKDIAVILQGFIFVLLTFLVFSVYLFLHIIIVKFLLNFRRKIIFAICHLIFTH